MQLWVCQMQGLKTPCINYRLCTSQYLCCISSYARYHLLKTAQMQVHGRDTAKRNSNKQNMQNSTRTCQELILSGTLYLKRCINEARIAAADVDEASIYVPHPLPIRSRHGRLLQKINDIVERYSQTQT